MTTTTTTKQQHESRFYEAPFVRMLRMRLASLKIFCFLVSVYPTDRTIVTLSYFLWPCCLKHFFSKFNYSFCQRNEIIHQLLWFDYLILIKVDKFKLDNLKSLLFDFDCFKLVLILIKRECIPNTLEVSFSKSLVFQSLKVDETIQILNVNALKK